MAGPTRETDWSIDYRQGYEDGYRRALNDLLSSLPRVCEDYAQKPAARAAEMDRVICPFEQYLERHIGRMSPDDFVTGGLGI
jgi:hypothetical protein